MRGRSVPDDEELREALPPSTGGREARVGLFVLLGGLSFLVVLFLMTDPSWFRGRYMVTTKVEEARGVRRGDPVQLNGVNIGRVHSFELTPDLEVVIALEIEGEYMIPVDSRARIETSLISGGWIYVERGASSEMVPPGGEIPGTSTPGLTETAEELSGRATLALERVETLLDAETVEAVQASARELHLLLADLARLTREQSDDIQRLIASLNRAAEGVAGISEGAGPSAVSAAARADTAFQHLASLSIELETASRSLSNVVGRLERGEGTLGRLSQDEALYDELVGAVESIRLLTTDIRENPGRYLTVQIRIF